MTCPRTESLDELVGQLADAGYEPHFNEIDAQMARSPFTVCTNCGARGQFTFTGMKNERSYLAFWTCQACGHWVEV
jgi:hypothetical protein